VWRVRARLCAATRNRQRRSCRAKNLSNNDRSRQLRTLVLAQFWRTKSDMTTVAVVDALATGTELAWMRALLHTVRGKAPGWTTTLAVPRPVLRAKAEEAAGRGGAPGGNVVSGQTIEAKTNKRG
jgi:hypothetical protein